jgi:hypothetical protein
MSILPFKNPSPSTLYQPPRLFEPVGCLKSWVGQLFSNLGLLSLPTFLNPMKAPNYPAELAVRRDNLPTQSGYVGGCELCSTRSTDAGSSADPKHRFRDMWAFGTSSGWKASLLPRKRPRVIGSVGLVNNFVLVVHRLCTGCAPVVHRLCTVCVAVVHCSERFGVWPPSVAGASKRPSCFPAHCQIQTVVVRIPLYFCG